MRVLGIETSSRRGSVALIDGGELVLAGSHDRPNAHAEEILPLIQKLMDQAGFSPGSLDRIAVGIGPGSFTGLRVGIGLGQGLSLGLGIPLVGVGSLRAMAAAASDADSRARCAVIDARRSELFVAIYCAAGSELYAPCVMPRSEAPAGLYALPPAGPRLLLGEIVSELGAEVQAFRSEHTDLPHAIWTARLGEKIRDCALPVEPLYVRDAGITLPALPPSPFRPAGHA